MELEFGSGRAAQTWLVSLAAVAVGALLVGTGLCLPRSVVDTGEGVVALRPDLGDIALWSGPAVLALGLGIAGRVLRRPELVVLAGLPGALGAVLVGWFVTRTAGDAGSGALITLTGVLLIVLGALAARMLAAGEQPADQEPAAR